jgi:hypothetical protein
MLFAGQFVPHFSWLKIPGMRIDWFLGFELPACLTITIR